MVDIPGGASGLLARDFKGKEADRLVTRIDPRVVSQVAELRGKRQAAKERGQWETITSAMRAHYRAGADGLESGRESLSRAPLLRARTNDGHALTEF